MSLEEKPAAAIAHSGTLSRKRPLHKSAGDMMDKDGEGPTEATHIRRLLIVGFIETLCFTSPNTANKSPNEIYDLEKCRFLVRFY